MCACQDPDPYTCYALMWGMALDSTEEEIQEAGGPCQCECHKEINHENH